MSSSVALGSPYLTDSIPDFLFRYRWQWFGADRWRMERPGLNT